MKVFVIEFYLNEKIRVGIVGGETEGDAWMKLLYHHVQMRELLVFKVSIQELKEPYFYIHPKGLENGFILPS